MGFLDAMIKILMKKAAQVVLDPTPPRASEQTPAWGHCVSCGVSLPAGQLRNGKCAACSLEEEHRASTPPTFSGRSALDAAYEKLECSPMDADSVVQARYREFAKMCHPDRVVPGAEKEAEALFRELKDARDLIMESRKSG